MSTGPDVGKTITITVEESQLCSSACNIVECDGSSPTSESGSRESGGTCMGRDIIVADEAGKEKNLIASDKYTMHVTQPHGLLNISVISAKRNHLMN